MLDQSIITQLNQVFKKLDDNVELNYKKSSHEKQNELIEMLKSVASTSDKILLTESSVSSDHPSFTVKSKYSDRVTFSGIPGGHEFSSLIIAILNSNLKGKLPDESLVDRMKNIKGPVSLRTFISLSCENCPDVVQALNLMAILNPDIHHEMIDGEYTQEEVKRLKIQGVPAVFTGDDMFNSGKTSLAELLDKLETTYGVKEEQTGTRDLGDFDVVVIGAGPAGASSAVYAARKGLKTAVITDRIGGQLQDTKGIENLISVPYTEGPELANKLNLHMSEYDIKVFEHRRVESFSKDKLKTITLTNNEELKTKSLIIATGAKWRELGVDGEKEYLGRGVAYCPHCDGPFYKGKDIAVVGGGNSGVEAAIDLAGIVKSVTVIEYGEQLKADQILIDKLNSLSNTKIIKNAATQSIKGNGDNVTSLIYMDRATNQENEIQLSGVFVQIGLLPNSQFAKGSVETNEYGEILVDDKCRTSTEGVYAAGDVTTVPYKQIIVAMGEGAKAGLSAFEDLMLK